MSIPQLGDDCNRVQPRIFRQRCRDNLERLCKGLETVRFLAFERLGVLGEETRNVDLGGSAAYD